ncbi:MAG: PspC domain-containing protein [Gemmatimonadota bacterium]|jgi:phage shock protein C
MAYLTRTMDDSVVAGVLGGIAEHFGWSAGRLRTGYVLLSILSAGFPGILFYFFLWFVIPDRSRTT